MFSFAVQPFFVKVLQPPFSPIADIDYGDPASYG